MMNKALLLSLLGVLGLSQAVEARTIFSCKTENNKYIEVQKVNSNTYEYNFGRASKKELTIRNKKSELLGRSDNWVVDSEQGARISFQNGEYMYSVWVIYDPTNEQTQTSGVNVERRGKLISQIYCTPETAQANFDDENFAW